VGSGSLESFVRARGCKAMAVRREAASPLCFMGQDGIIIRDLLF
jgi:hypothetical protein